MEKRKYRIEITKLSLYPLKRAEKSSPLKSSRYFKTSHKSERYNFLFSEIRHSGERETFNTRNSSSLSLFDTFQLSIHLPRASIPFVTRSILRYFHQRPLSIHSSSVRTAPRFLIEIHVSHRANSRVRSFRDRAASFRENRTRQKVCKHVVRGKVKPVLARLAR